MCVVEVMFKVGSVTCIICDGALLETNQKQLEHDRIPCSIEKASLYLKIRDDIFTFPLNAPTGQTCRMLGVFSKRLAYHLTRHSVYCFCGCHGGQKC